MTTTTTTTTRPFRPFRPFFNAYATNEQVITKLYEVWSPESRAIRAILLALPAKETAAAEHIELANLILAE